MLQLPVNSRELLHEYLVAYNQDDIIEFVIAKERSDCGNLVAHKRDCRSRVAPSQWQTRRSHGIVCSYFLPRVESNFCEVFLCPKEHELSRANVLPVTNTI